MAPRTCSPVTLRGMKPNNGCFVESAIVPVFGLESARSSAERTWRWEYGKSGGTGYSNRVRFTNVLPWPSDPLLGFFSHTSATFVLKSNHSGGRILSAALCHDYETITVWAPTTRERPVINRLWGIKVFENSRGFGGIHSTGGMCSLMYWPKKLIRCVNFFMQLSSYNRVGEKETNLYTV